MFLCVFNWLYYLKKLILSTQQVNKKHVVDLLIFDRKKSTFYVLKIGKAKSQLKMCRYFK